MLATKQFSSKNFDPFLATRSFQKVIDQRSRSTQLLSNNPSHYGIDPQSVDNFSEELFSKLHEIIEEEEEDLAAAGFLKKTPNTRRNLKEEEKKEHEEEQSEKEGEKEQNDDDEFDSPSTKQQKDFDFEDCHALTEWRVWLMLPEEESLIDEKEEEEEIETATTGFRKNSSFNNKNFVFGDSAVFLQIKIEEWKRLNLSEIKCRVGCQIENVRSSLSRENEIEKLAEEYLGDEFVKIPMHVAWSFDWCLDDPSAANDDEDEEEERNICIVKTNFREEFLQRVLKKDI